jgi:hypothetical protein
LNEAETQPKLQQRGQSVRKLRKVWETLGAGALLKVKLMRSIGAWVAEKLSEHQ